MGRPRQHLGRVEMQMQMGTCIEMGIWMHQRHCLSHRCHPQPRLNARRPPALPFGRCRRCVAHSLIRSIRARVRLHPLSRIVFRLSTHPTINPCAQVLDAWTHATDDTLSRALALHQLLPHTPSDSTHATPTFTLPWVRAAPFFIPSVVALCLRWLPTERCSLWYAHARPGHALDTK
jgi:hypothetical protein